MRKTSILFLCALAAVAQTTQKPGTLMSGSMMSMSNGVGLKLSYSTVVEPPPEHMSTMKISGGASGFGRDKVVHRYMVDQVNNQFFGYDLGVAPGLTPGHFTITISPLTLQPKDFGGRVGGGAMAVAGGRTSTYDPSTLQQVPLPTYPPPQDVQEGDTVALDLLVSPDGKQKVVDYFQVSSYGGSVAAPLVGGGGGAGAGALVKDYALDDGVPHYDFEGMKVSVNGKPAGLTGFTGKAGVTLWVSAPGQGRYIISLLPHEGFQKAGTIRDSVLSFQSDGQEFELSSTSMILGRRGAWNLYVMHDLRYSAKPDGVFWGTDRLENLVPQQ